MATRHSYEEMEFLAGIYDSENEHILSKSKDVDFYVACSKGSGGRTLELGCGTGRVLIPTAISGCQITGLDHSPYMLSKCQEKLNSQPMEVQKRVRLDQGNLTDFDTNEEYALATLPFHVFQGLPSVEEQKACLICANEHLRSYGRLIINVTHPFPPESVYDPKYAAEREDLPETELPDGRKLRRAVRIAGFHRDRQCNDVELIYYVSHPDGRTERLVNSFPFRYFYRYEVEHLLELCGFKVVELFGDFDRSAFSDDSPEMIFVAERGRKVGF